MKLLLENRERLQDIGMSKELGSVALKYRKQKQNEDTTKFLQREETTRFPTIIIAQVSKQFNS